MTRLLRTKRQRQFLIAYPIWLLVTFLLFWLEPYAVEERWDTFQWVAWAPLAVFALIYLRDILGLVSDGLRRLWRGAQAVRAWIDRGA
jgi:hypothetical protein